MPDQDGYPTEEELETLAKWSGDDALALIEYIKSIWWAPDWGFVLKGKRVLKLELHTGGWSGNEEIIGVLMNNFFWHFYWEKSERGGHYYFEIGKGLGHGVPLIQIRPIKE